MIVGIFIISTVIVASLLIAQTERDDRLSRKLSINAKFICKDK